MISVVMPTYNSARFVSQGIESILAQTYTDFELIVCDDGSVDGTLDIVEGYARRDARIRLLRHGFRSVSLNTNAAAAAATRPWLARLDADDIAKPNRLARQMESAQAEPQVVCWAGAASIINRRGRRLRDVVLGPQSEAEFQAQRQSGRVIYMLGPTTFIRRDVFLEVGGYDPAFDSADDIELLARLAERGSLRTVPEVLASYRIHGLSFTASRAAHQERLFRFIRARNLARLAGGDLKLADFLADLGRQPLSVRLNEQRLARARQLYRNAGIHLAEGRLLRGAGAGGLAMLLDPARTLRRLRLHLPGSAVRRTTDDTRFAA